MSSLPLISHHLFVAAIDQSASLSGQDPESTESGPASRLVALEVLDWSEPLPELTPRSLYAGHPASY